MKRKKLVKLLDMMPDKESLITANVLMPVLKVSIYSHTKEFKQELSHLRIGWKSGAIRMESI